MFDLHGGDMFGEAVKADHHSKLGGEFLIPPFTVLSAREGWWQDRKRAWLALGIQSELGRGDAHEQTNARSRAMELAGGFSKKHGLARNLNDGTVLGGGGLSDQLAKASTARNSPGGAS